MTERDPVRQPSEPAADHDDGGGRRRWMQSAHAGHLSSVGWDAGPTSIVAVHDLGESATVWAPVGPLVRGGLVAVDLPGHGRSSAAQGAPPTPARASLALLDAAWSFAPQASLVAGRGHGAAAALAGARRRPDRFRAVAVLAAPDAHGTFTADDVAAVTVPVLLLRPRDTELDTVAAAVAEVGTATIIDIDGSGDVLASAPQALATALASAIEHAIAGAGR